MGETISFAANGGTCSGYLTRAHAPDAPGVVVVQEWWGLNDHIKDLVDRFAAVGYTALAPDLYHGAVTREPDEAQKDMMALDIAGTAQDLRGAIAYLRVTTHKPVGVVGFCMGGALSLFAACENGDDVAACADFYGAHPSVSFNFETLTAPVLGVFAGKDHMASPEVVDALDTQLSRLGKEHSFTRYPEADHAFFNDTRPEVYDRAAAQDAWQKLLAFFGQHLH